MPRPPKKRRRGRQRKTHFPSRRQTIALLLTVIGLAAVTFALYYRQPLPTLTTPAKQPPAQIKKNVPPPPRLPAIKTGPAKARFALVIDDMGYHQKIGDALLDLPLDLSFAFLPFAPHTESQLHHARSRRRDILLHLPMEATDKKWNPGPGALFLTMNRQTLQRTVLQDLAAIPGAIGINNHMGSRFTENEPAMRSFLSILKKRHLFFLDSQTSSKSVGIRIARELGISALHRNVFLDNQQDKEIIKKQLNALIVLAKKQGVAIGIAHPHQATLDALRDFLRQQDKSVVLVSISSLLGDQEKIGKTKLK